MDANLRFTTRFSGWSTTTKKFISENLSGLSAYLFTAYILWLQSQARPLFKLRVSFSLRPLFYGVQCGENLDTDEEGGGDDCILNYSLVKNKCFQSICEGNEREIPSTQKRKLFQISNCLKIHNYFISSLPQSFFLSSFLFPFSIYRQLEMIMMK